MTITGTISNVIFSGRGFSVIVIQTDEGQMETVAGRIYEPQIDMKITAEGSYVDHPKYGKQFNVTSCKMELPKTRSAVIRYLSLLPGVGGLLAINIVSHFGVNVAEEIIEKDPMRLTEIPGISTKKAEAIKRAHSEKFVYQELANFDLTPNQIHKLYEHYGEKAASVIRKTPYQTIHDVPGFGFKTVDDIARKNGVPIDAPERIAAAITFVLTEIGNQGHCWSRIESVDALLQNIIPDVPKAKIADVLAEELKNERIILENNRLYAIRLYCAEKGSAKHIAYMLKNTQELMVNKKLPLTEKAISAAIESAEFDYGFELDNCQKQAVRIALQNRFSVITGGPGTGKSTLISAIISGWMTQFPNDEPEEHILLCAPTGKAARRMSEITGVYAETIHRILNRTSKNDDVRDEKHVNRKMIIVDEASMLDLTVAYELLKFAREDHFLVLVGDVDQLPPIGPGHLLRDCVNSPFIPTVQLEYSHRYGGAIAINAKRINEGQGLHSFTLNDPSFQFISADKTIIQNTVIDLYVSLLKNGYSVSDICCVVPINKAGKSQTSASDLNELIRERVNPAGYSSPGDKRKFRVGDRVMNTENDYDNDVFNGDCGIVSSVEPDAVTVLLDDGRSVVFNQYRMDFLILAYAMTVHKSQGSQYKAVIVANSMEHSFMLQRNLLYTAVTRAKENVFLCGDPDAVNLAVGRIPSLERNTSLKDRIKILMVKNR